MLRLLCAIFLLVLGTGAKAHVWSPVADRPSEDVVKVFQTLQLPITPNPSLQELNAIAQDRFMRSKGCERLSEKALAFYRKNWGTLSLAQREELTALFEKIGTMGDVEAPSSKPPSFVLILGSTVQNMRGRVMFVNNQVRKSLLRFDGEKSPELDFLLGKRPLFKDASTTSSPEDKNALVDPSPYPLKPGWRVPTTLPEDEVELGEWVWGQLALSKPLADQHVFFIKAPKKEGQSRSQTDDTVNTFIEEREGSFPKGAVFWVVSSNPFIEYQTQVVELCFRKALGKEVDEKGYTFVGVGFGQTSPSHPLDADGLGTQLDNLASVLYTRVQLEALKAKGGS